MLKCVCRTHVRPLCPTHACGRHFARIMTGGATHQSPLLPGPGGEVPPKGAVYHAIRDTATAAGMPTQPTTGRPLRESRRERALFLSTQGVATTTIQLLGRWSSKAVERYTQKAPLASAHLVQEADNIERTPDTLETPHLGGAIHSAQLAADGEEDRPAVSWQRRSGAADTPVVHVPVSGRSRTSGRCTYCTPVLRGFTAQMRRRVAGHAVFQAG